MEAKEFLDEIFIINKRINLVKKELDAIKETDEKYPIKISVQNDLEKILTISLDNLKNYRMKLYELISEVPDGMARCVLEYRYITLLNFDEIANNLFYSRRQILRYYNEGLDYLSDIIKNRL